jgi:hypothetical protein
VCLGVFFFFFPGANNLFSALIFKKKNTTNYVSFDAADNRSSVYPNSSHHQGAGKLKQVSFCPKTLFSHKKYINTLVTFKNQFIKLKKTLKRSKNTKLNQVNFFFSRSRSLFRQK